MGRNQLTLPNILLAALITLAVVVGTVCVFQMRGGLSPTNDLTRIIRWLWIGLGVLLAIAVVVLFKLSAALWPGGGQNKRSGLLARVTVLFSAIAIVPTVLLIIFSVTAFNIGVQAWFSVPVSTAINEAEAVSEAYLREHKQTLVVRALEIATDLARDHQKLLADPLVFNQTIDNLSFDYEINEAVVLNSRNFRLAFGGMSPLASAFLPKVTQSEYNQADLGDVVLIDSGDQRSVDAIVKLENFEEAYLYITKFVDPKIVERVKRTGDAARTYADLNKGKERFQSAFLLIFSVVGMLLLLSVLGFGMVFASNLTGPIRRLTATANRLAEGDLGARMELAKRRDGSVGRDEITVLSETFNRMASRLGSQQSELQAANEQLERRRKFTEAVLSGVSAGVIGLDSGCLITLPNRSASLLLDTDLSDARGKPLSEFAPAFSDKVSEVIGNFPAGRIKPVHQQPVVFEEVSLKVKGVVRTFRLVIVREKSQSAEGRYILTFDDITDLQLAERKAAWSDVARRIAHEIKNPLTPIQLSAERLKRRYAGQISNGRETFDMCTDTIIRQVGDIGRMVDAFANFARTPAPVMLKTDVRDICQQAVFLQNNRGTDVVFEAVLPPHPVMHEIDAGLISQSLLNLLKNGGEAIETRRAGDPAFAGPSFIGSGIKGRVRLTLVAPDPEQGRTSLGIYVQDNGCGIPQELRAKLTEPYVTTRAKGTGLGLAIVKKILEDHGGSLLVDQDVPEHLTDALFDGACFSLILG